jgi:transketolase
MRTAFIEELHRLAETDARINLVVGDLGYSVVEKFAGAYPDRFLNAGVAEQNMITLSAGLAIGGGLTVFTYSIANFATMRCLEQIRNDVCYHGADVKIVIVGGGVAYGTHGYTHFAVEDMAVMRAMPGMVVAVPADPVESVALTELAVRNDGPWYLRLGRNNEPVIHQKGLNGISVGDMISVRNGSRGSILATGPVLFEAMKAGEKLYDIGIDVSIWSVPFIKPFDHEKLAEIASESAWIMCVEDHGPCGGLGSVVAEALVKCQKVRPYVHLCFPEMIAKSGSQEYLRELYGLDCNSIVGTISKIERQTRSKR